MNKEASVLLRNASKWDVYFMTLCHDVATRSKDESTKLGCVIVGPDMEIRSTGYNSFPRGVHDDVAERQQRPLKYLWIEHSERNAIYNAARMGTGLKNCVLYCPWLPRYSTSGVGIDFVSGRTFFGGLFAKKFPKSPLNS